MWRSAGYPKRLFDIAVAAVALVLLEEHISHCVAEAISTGGPEAEAKVKEASAAIARLVRS